MNPLPPTPFYTSSPLRTSETMNGPHYYTLSTLYYLWNSIYASRLDSYSHTRREILTQNYLNRSVQIPHGMAGELLIAFRLNFTGAENTRATLFFTNNEGEEIPPLTRYSVPLASKREEWVSMNYPIPIDMILGLNMGLLIAGESIGQLEVEFLYVRVSDIPNEVASSAWAFVDSSGALAWYGDWRERVGTPFVSRASLLTKDPPLFPSAPLPVKYLPPLSFLLSSKSHAQWKHPEKVLQIQSFEHLLDPPILSCEGRTQV